MLGSPVHRQVGKERLIRTLHLTTMHSGTASTADMPEPRANIIGALTGIRGYAALWVVLYHLRRPIEMIVGDSLPWFVHATYLGYLGVDLFAFLSGFIIAYTYSEQLRNPSLARTGRYLWVRLARIYPLVLFVLWLYVLNSAREGGVDGLTSILSDKSFWLQVFMLNGWGLEENWAWNIPSWTVSSEWFCYLCFPLVAPLIARIKSGLVASVLAIVTLSGTIALMVIVGHPTFDAFLDFGLIRIGGEFLTGCWLFALYRIHGSLNLPWGWIGLGSLVTAIALCTTYPAVSVVGFAVVVYALAQNQQPLNRLFANPISIYLGEISYSIYMLHYFVIERVLAWYGPSWTSQPEAYVLAAVAAVLIAAAASHALVENPSRKFLRQQLASGDSPTPA